MPCPSCGTGNIMHNSWCRIHEDKTQWLEKKRIQDEVWSARDNPEKLRKISHKYNLRRRV